MQVAGQQVYDYNFLITQLVAKYAIANSGKDASVDLQGTSDWWKKYFKDLSPISASTDAGASDVVLRNDTYTYKQVRGF